MPFDGENGVTIMAVLRAEQSFFFSEPVQYAVVTDFELQEKNLTFSDLHNGLFQGDQALAAFTQTHQWCYLKTGSFDAEGAPPTACKELSAANFAHQQRMSRTLV